VLSVVMEVVGAKEAVVVVVVMGEKLEVDAVKMV
jgi:hypothetical protein